jgi:hypothetical protein
VLSLNSGKLVAGRPLKRGDNLTSHLLPELEVPVDEVFEP